MENYDRYYCRWSYDEFRLREPHIKTDGLWQAGDWYYIKCEDLSDKPLEETDMSLEEYFDYAIKTAGAPVKLVEKVPEGAVRVDERSLEEVAALHGSPLNASEFNQQLAVLLPPEFPMFSVSFQGNHWLVRTSRTLTANEKKLFKDLLIKKGILVNETVVFTLFSPQQAKKEPSSSNLIIIPSKFFQKDISSTLRKKWEFDEQLWVDNYIQLWTSPKDFKNEKTNKSSCLVDVSCQANFALRNYVVLFEEVFLIAPLHVYQDSVFSTLEVTEKELIQLAGMKKIKLVFPHSLERYNLSLLEQLTDENPDSVILTRELALKTMIDSRQRNPLLYAPLSISERQTILSVLIRIADQAEEEVTRKFFTALSKELIRIWSNMEHLLAVRGSMAIPGTGSGILFGEILKTLTGKNYVLELIDAAMPVEWAGALNATVCPNGPEGRQHNTAQLAYMLSGIRPDNKIDLFCKPNLATEGILTIAKHVPVVELARDFKSGDIQRFHRLVKNISNHHPPAEMEVIIEHFNNEVRQYDHRSRNLQVWDIKGLILEGVNSLAGFFIPSVIWNLFAALLLNQAEKHPSFGYVLDKLKASVYHTTPDAVLVSRMVSKARNHIY